eukprot:7379243-Prymnesium_polylepis.1
MQLVDCARLHLGEVGCWELSNRHVDQLQETSTSSCKLIQERYHQMHALWIQQLQVRSRIELVVVGNLDIVQPLTVAACEDRSIGSQLPCPSEQL